MNATKASIIVFAAALLAAIAGSWIGGKIGERVGASFGHVGDESIPDAFLGGTLGSLAGTGACALWIAPALGIRRSRGLLIVLPALVLDWAYFLLLQPKLGLP